MVSQKNFYRKAFLVSTNGKSVGRLLSTLSVGLIKFRCMQQITCFAADGGNCLPDSPNFSMENLFSSKRLIIFRLKHYDF